MSANNIKLSAILWTMIAIISPVFEVSAQTSAGSGAAESSVSLTNEAHSSKRVALRDRASLATDSRTAVKLNAAVFVGIVNPGVEFKVLRNATVQLEALGVFANTSFLGTGKPLELGAGFGEFRYYVKRAFDGFYFGPTLGFGVYKLNKSLVLRYSDQYLDGSYQQGTNVMCGLTVGYALNLNKHWSIEASWSGGFQHSKYEGYKPNPDYNESANNSKYIMYVTNNGSAEWPPMFKCGLFVSYRW